MADLLGKLRVATWVVHVLAGLALAWVLSKTGAMAGWCIFPGALIAFAGAAASPGRPIASYLAFGALMGFSFWEGVSAIHSGHPIALLPALGTMVGVSWFLRDPGWPSFGFTAVVVGLCLALMAWIYEKRFELATTDPADAVDVVRTAVVMLAVGASYLALGFAEVRAGRARRKRKRTSAIRTPTGTVDL